MRVSILMMAGEGSVYTPSDVTEDLTAAAMWGDVQLLESFLSNGADPNLPNNQGNTALHVACYYGERECASILLNYKGMLLERERERIWCIGVWFVIM